MPELPEVETIKRDLNKLIVGKKILDVQTDTPKMVQPSLRVVKKAVVGKEIVSLSRRAKLLIVELGDNNDDQNCSILDPTIVAPKVEQMYKKAAESKVRKTGQEIKNIKIKKKKVFLAVHLKLTGRLLFRSQKAKKDDWVRILITLSGGKELRFADLRKFGWMRLVTNQELRIMNQEFGVEPFDKEFTTTYLKQIFSRTSKAIKLVLLDQSKISGVGNIYACEALFLARIDSKKQAKKLSNEEIKKLRESIIKALKAGIKYRGASDQYYLDALGKKGAYQDHFLVYAREGKKCFSCQGRVKKIKVGGRGTYYCPKCQK